MRRSPSRSQLRMLALVVLAWLCMWLDDARAADVCGNTGLPSPEVRTAIVSPLNPAKEVWVIGPDCDLSAVQPYSEIYISLYRRGIERVESLPQYMDINLEGNPLSRGADVSNASGVELSAISSKGLGNIVFSGLDNEVSHISISDSTLTSLRGISLPGQLESLKLTQTKLKSMKGIQLPATLTKLVLNTSDITTIDFTLPPLLQSLQITSAPLTTIQNVVFPDSIQNLEFAGSKIAVVKGVTWPSQLDHLGFKGNPLVEFEIREYDVPMLKGLRSFIADISQGTCSDATATPTLVKSKTLCVISDERFELLYRSSPTSPTPIPKVKPTKNPSSGANGSTSTNEDEGGLDPLEADPQEEESSVLPSNLPSEASEFGNSTELSTTRSTDEPSSGSNGQPLSEIDPDNNASGNPPTTVTTVIETKSSPSTTLATVFAVLVSVLAVAIVAWIIRSCILSKRNKRGDDNITNDKYTRAETPSGSTAEVPLFQEYLANDVRNDESMLRFHVDQKDIMLSKQIARGGYGVIYRGVFEGRDVAVKQMLPGTWQDGRALASFMDEIRLCATLDHPKIVSFVGFAFSSLRDLSVVIEFMPGGDLHVLLQKQQDLPRSAQDWSQPWTSTKIKSKASIGQDVAEAVAYLHALEKPILHRDLKARNVLLDLDGNAKLSDFGISREQINETMTSEVGTAAWIAPEVLRGARYSEKADIYSLGVLLVELDRCQHPYADEPMFQRDGSRQDGNATNPMRPSTFSEAAQKNTQIAVLVSTGKLRPSVSSDCPEQVAMLVAQCLSFDPENRPSAIAVARTLSELVA